MARRLQTLSEDDPDQYRPAVEAFCKRTDRTFSPFWYAFLECWDWVKFPEGKSGLTWAIDQAKKNPYPLDYCPGWEYGLLASIAWHLSRLRGTDPFWLPQPALVTPLGFDHPSEVGRVIKLLKKNGIIVCVNEDYSFRGKDRKAKEYRFIGRPLDASPGRSPKSPALSSTD